MTQRSGTSDNFDYGPTFQQSAVGIAHLALDGRLLRLNPTFCAIVDYTPAEMQAMALHDITFPDDRAEDAELLRRLRSGEATTGTREKRFVRRDGSALWARVTTSVVHDAQGRADYLIAVVEDIAARRAAEQAVRQSEALHRAVLHTAVDAIITIDERGRIRSANPSAERMFGYTSREMHGRNVSMLMPEPDRSRHDDYMRAYLQTGKARIIGIGRDVTAQRKDGSTFPINLAVSEVREHDRRIFTGVVHDLTQRKQLERELLEISDREQRRIGQDLHDGLGQELAAIGFLSKSLQTRLSAEGSAHAADAAQIADLAARTIREARGLARGLHPVEPNPAGLMSALEQLAASVQSIFHIGCTFECPAPVLVEDTAAATHLYRIAQEAVTNAVRHGKAGHVRISLQTSGNLAALSVEDDGVGMPAEPSPGGMGLRIMQRRAAIIGAAISLGSVAGGGTVVRCTFPYQTQDDDFHEDDDQG
jgi:PAS domain S-box-containing protein